MPDFLGDLLRRLRWLIQQRLDIFETRVTVTPQQENSKILQKFPKILNVYFWGKNVYFWGDNVTFGIIGVFGFWEFLFCCLGVLGTPWVGGPRRGFRKYPKQRANTMFANKHGQPQTQEIPPKPCGSCPASGKKRRIPRVHKISQEAHDMKVCRASLAQIGLPQKGVRKRRCNSSFLRLFACVFVCLQVCARLSADSVPFSGSLKSSFGCVCARLFAFVRVCKHPLLLQPLLRHPDQRESATVKILKFTEGHHPRGTTLREALRGNLPLRGLCGGLSEGSARSLRGFCGVSAGFCRGPRIFRGFRG